MNQHVANLGLLPKRTLGRASGPLYRQLADLLRKPISDGNFAVGSELPKEAHIAEHFGVSLITVRQALARARSGRPDPQALGQAGGGHRAHALGRLSAGTSRISPTWPPSPRTPQLKVKSYRKEKSPVLQRHFGLAADEAGYCLRSILSVGKQRKAQITTYFPADIGARVQQGRFHRRADLPLRAEASRTALGVAHVTVRAEIADETVAADLGIAIGRPDPDRRDALSVGRPAQHRVLDRPASGRSVQHHLRRAERPLGRRASCGRYLVRRIDIPIKL